MYVLFVYLKRVLVRLSFIFVYLCVHICGCLFTGAWVAHTQALREAYPPPPVTLPSLPASCASERASEATTAPALDHHLSVNMDMAIVVRAMLRPDSGQ